MLWAQIKGISPLNFSVLWRGSQDLLWHSGTCQLRIIGINSQISSPHLLPQTVSCTAPVRKYCNAQYPVFCSYFAFFLPFLTGHSFLWLLPAHHIPPPFCAVMSLHFPSAQLLCSLSMVIFVHFSVSCHSLSAIPSHLLKRAFCGKADIAVGLDISLSDALILWAYSMSTFAVFQVPQTAPIHTP